MIHDEVCVRSAERHASLDQMRRILRHPIDDRGDLPSYTFSHLLLDSRIIEAEAIKESKFGGYRLCCHVSARDRAHLRQGATYCVVVQGD